MLDSFIINCKCQNQLKFITWWDVCLFLKLKLIHSIVFNQKYPYNIYLEGMQFIEAIEFKETQTSNKINQIKISLFRHKTVSHISHLSLPMFR
jgi:hypothetical protein